MSGPEAALLPREPAAGTPVFAEPWHAEVLAVAFALTRDGIFSAGEWADALGADWWLVSDQLSVDPFDLGGGLSDGRVRRGGDGEREFAVASLGEGEVRERGRR